ncbi:MAG TPA: hypothetical protein PLV92_30570, partial [Pirellulaceae bacterium]|nr:hypothetical protein [Pirellulaceae bacterium]
MSAPGGGGQLDLSGTTTWTAGTLSTSATLRNLAGGVFTLSGGNARRIENAGTLANEGTVVWTDNGGLQGFNGGVIQNRETGLFDIQNDQAAVYICCSANSTFSNRGTLRKSSGGGTTRIEWAVDNSGTIDVASGTLDMAGGGVSTGAFTIQSNATLGFAGGSHSLSSASSVSGAGTLRISGGVADFNGAVTLTNPTSQTSVTGGTANFNSQGATTTLLQITGGTLGGVGTLTVTGAGDWSGGTMSGTGTTSIASGATWGLSGGASKRFDNGRKLDVAGTVTWTGTGNLDFFNGDAVRVLVGGLFDIRTDAAFNYICCSAGSTITNLGTVRKSAG